MNRAYLNYFCRNRLAAGRKQMIIGDESPAYDQKTEAKESCRYGSN